MFPHAERFDRWLRRTSPHATTAVHYLNDLKLFLTWAGKAPQATTLCDVDAYVDHCRQLGHAVATVNRRLAAMRTFCHFLQTESGAAPPNPVLPRRHLIRQGRRLPPLRQSQVTWNGFAAHNNQAPAEPGPDTSLSTRTRQTAFMTLPNPDLSPARLPVLSSLVIQFVHTAIPKNLLLPCQVVPLAGA